jgi:hypothetical protein
MMKKQSPFPTKSAVAFHDGCFRFMLPAEKLGFVSEAIPHIIVAAHAAHQEDST